MSEEQQFEDTYLNRRQQLRKMIGRYVHANDIEDVIQDTYLRAWQHREKFKGNSSLQTWIYSIARNQALTILSRKRPHTQLQREPLTTDPIEEVDLVYAIIALTLRDDKYEAVIHHWLEGYTINESADRIGCNRGSVIYQRNRIRMIAQQNKKSLLGSD